MKKTTVKQATTPSLCMALGALFLATFVYAIFIKYLQIQSFNVHDYDTGIYSNVAWNIANGNGFYSHALLKNHLGEHFSPITAFAAPLYFLCNTPMNVFILIAAAYALTFVVLYFLLKEMLSPLGTKTAIAVWLLLAGFFFVKPLNSALYFQFHPSTLAMPFIALGLLALHKKKTILLCVSLFFLLLTKENASLAVIGLGIYSLLLLNDKKMALLLFALAGVYALLVFKIIMPAFQDGHWAHYSRLGVTTAWGKKLSYLRYLMASFAFLPLFAPRALLCAIPLIALNLSVSMRGQFSLHYHYDDMACVFLLAAAAHGIVFLAPRLKLWKKAASVILIAAMALSYINANSTSLKQKKLRLLLEQIQSEPFVQLRKELRPYQADTSLTFLSQMDLGPYLNMRTGYFPIRETIIGKDLPPGALVIVSPVAGNFQLSPTFFKDLEEDPRLYPVHKSPVLAVYGQREQ